MCLFSMISGDSFSIEIIACLVGDLGPYICLPFTRILGR